jgi:hypothetical protein
MKTTLLLVAAGIALVASMSGCSSTPRLKNPQNIVIVDPAGRLCNAQGLPANRQWLTNVFDPLANTPSLTNILIFFQGGMNDFADGIDRANKLPACITNAPQPYYPIFFTWNSSLLSAWWDHSTRVLPTGEDQRKRNYFQPLLTVPADLGRAIGRIPLTVVSTTRNLIESCYDIVPLPAHGKETNIPVTLRLRDKREQRLLYQAYTNLHSQNMTIILETNKTTHFRQVKRVWQSAVLAYPNLLGSLLVDSGGKQGWDQMVRRTDTMFVRPGNYTHGGTELFVQSLTNFLGQHPNYHVTLVAHSMGSIIANEIIRRHGPALHIENIVYMAAACSVQDFTKCVVPFLQSSTNVHFYNLCLNPANERAEDHMGLIDVPVINWVPEILAPHGSLLQWIDDYYANADTQFDWTMGKLENSLPGLTASKIPPEILPRITLKAFGTGSLKNCGPQKHGDFSDIKYWDPNFWQNDWTPDMYPPRECR